MVCQDALCDGIEKRVRLEVERMVLSREASSNAESGYILGFRWVFSPLVMMHTYAHAGYKEDGKYCRQVHAD